MSGTFELTNISKVNLLGVQVFRIRALIDIPGFGVKAGDLGGWVESVNNLSGSAWVSDEAEVSGDAHVFGDAQVFGYARVHGNAQVFDDARVFGYAWVYGDAEVYGYAQVYGDARVFGNARIFDNTHVFGFARVFWSWTSFPAIKGTVTWICSASLHMSMALQRFMRGKGLRK